MYVFFKEQRWRCEVYLNFIRDQDCCGCGRRGPSEAHHWGPGKGMGRKCSDCYTVPLCHACHSDWHQKRCIGPRDADESMELQVLTQRDMMAKWMQGNVQGDDDAKGDRPTRNPPPSRPWTAAPPPLEESPEDRAATLQQLPAARKPPPDKSPGQYLYNQVKEDEGDDIF